MNTPSLAPSKNTFGPPIPCSQARCNQLETQITELSAHIHAATYRLLELIRRFRVYTVLSAAREKVRVAHALKNLPKISDKFRLGEVSYSKVRAMTRVATEKNEDYLLMIARHGTASHVERVVRNYRKVKRTEALERDNERHALRELDWHFDEHGCLMLKGRFTPEQGVVIKKVLDLIMDEDFQEQQDVSAETSRRLSCDAGVVHWLENKKGEPLSVGRKTRTIPPAIRRALKRRDHGCRFPGCTCSRFVDAHHITHWTDGGETKIDNLVLLCRRHHRMVHEEGFGVYSQLGGQIYFTDPQGRNLPDSANTRFRGNVFELTAENSRSGIQITPKTGECRWGGEKLDNDLAILCMLQLE